MTITRNVLEWTERKMTEIKPDDKFGGAKAFGLGFIEGWIDGSVILYPILVTSMITLGIIENQKNK